MLPGMPRIGVHKTADSARPTAGPRRSVMRAILVSALSAGLALFGSGTAFATGVPVDSAPSGPAATEQTPSATPPTDQVSTETAPSDEVPAEPTPPASPPAPPETPAVEPPSPEPASPEPADTAVPSSEGTQAAPDQVEAQPQVTTPDAAEVVAPAPPYLRWQVIDAAGAVQTGTSVQLQGVKDISVADDSADSQWAAALTSTVPDNFGQDDYVGLDLDPTAGAYLVKQLVDEVDPVVTHDVAANEQFRIRPALAAEGFVVGDSAAWLETSSVTTAEETATQLVLQMPAPAEGSKDQASAKALNIGILSVGSPDGATPPYVYWNAKDANGAPLAGLVFDIQGRKSNGNNSNDGSWGGNSRIFSVTDNTGQSGYSGRDLDPDPGEFVVKQLTTSNPSDDREVRIDSRYRVRATSAPAGYTLSNTAWVEIAGISNNSTSPKADEWVNSTFNFGTFNVTMPPSTQDIVVRKRVFANPSGVTSPVSTNIGTNYSNTVGAVFRLYENSNSAPGQPTNFTCTISTNGECTITVTGVNNGGTNYNKRYWVVEDAPVSGSAAAATYSNPDLYVGNYEGPQDRRRLVGLTKQVTATSATMFMPMTASGVTGGTVLTDSELPGTSATVAEAGSFGALANSLGNPGIDPKCSVVPLRIGIVIDQSASIDSGEWTTFRNALVQGNDSVLGVLKGAGSLVSILGFGTDVTPPNNGWHYGGSGPQALPTNYSPLIPTTRPGGGTNGTNWDAALSTIESVNGTSKFDMVLFVTDGAPNYILNGAQPSSSNVTLRSLEAPLYAANSIKAAGTRMVAIGVGSGATTSQVGANLRAVSGTVANSDYLQGDWDRLKDILTDVVKAATCTLPIEVSKTEVSNVGAPVLNAPDWGFTASKTGADVTLSTPASKTTTAGTGGTAKWDLTFTQPSGQTADLTLTETAQDDWSLTGVTCTVAGVDYPVTVVGESVTLTGLNPTSQKVYCVFTNSKTQTGGLAIDKTFGTSVPTGSGPTGVTFTGNYTCVLNATTVASGTWSRTGTGAATLTPATGTPAATQIPAGASCSVTETTPSGGLPNDSWQWDTPSIGAAVTIVNKETQTITVTNKAKRVYGNFSVTKVVPTGNQADATNNYSGGWSCTLGTETKAGPWGEILADETWTSTNTDQIPLGATCTVTSETRPTNPVASDPSWQWDGTPVYSAAVTATQADLGTITVTNKTKQVLGSATWSKVDASGSGLLKGSEWELTGPGTTGSPVTIEDCISGDCAGMPDQDPTPGKFKIVNLNWGSYQLKETTAPLGYILDTTAHAFTIDVTHLDVPVGAIENSAITPPQIPLTGGLSSAFYTMSGLGALVVAAGAMGALRMRRRRA